MHSIISEVGYRFSSIFCGKKGDCTLTEIDIYLGLTAFTTVVILEIQACFKGTLKEVLEFDTEQKSVNESNRIETISRNEYMKAIRGLNILHEWVREAEEDFERKMENACFSCCMKLFYFLYIKIKRIIYIFSIFIKLCFMSMYIFDFFSDLNILINFLLNGYFKLFLINAAPGFISSLINGILLRWIFLTETGQSSMSCLSRFVLLFVSIIPKAYITGWMIFVGEQSWKKRWYLRALSYLHVIEICIEGFPQFLIEYLEFQTDIMSNVQGYVHNEKWAMWSSLLCVIVSVTRLTFTFDKDEDIEASYDDVQNKKGRIVRSVGEFWKLLKCGSCQCCFSFLSFIIACIYMPVCFLDRVADILPRWYLYSQFLKFKLYGFIIFISLFLVSNIGSFLYFYFSSTNQIKNNDFKIKYAIGTVANITFLFDWRFSKSDHRKGKDYILFIQYYLWILIMSGIVYQDITNIFPVMYIMGIHIFFKSLRFLFRWCLRELYKKEMKKWVITSED